MLFDDKEIVVVMMMEMRVRVDDHFHVELIGLRKITKNRKIDFDDNT